MKLTLPYPISANRYWETYVQPGARFANTFVTKEAESYKRDVKIAAYDQDCRVPFKGRVSLAIELYPNRPKDWEKRARADPMNWDDDVRCIDVDNACKVLLDALKKTAYADDAQVWRLQVERMEPIGEACVVVTIEPIIREDPRLALFDARKVTDPGAMLCALHTA